MAASMAPLAKTFPLRNARVRFAGETNIGRKRQLNEDSYYVPGDMSLIIVADGMGGHASGEVASRMAVETVIGYFTETQEDCEQTWPYKMDGHDRYDLNRLVTATKLANLRIWQTAQRSERQHGMGTTLVTAYFVDDFVFIGHVGDSRCYRVRDGMIHQLTEDHSLLNDYVRMKKLRTDEIGNFQHKNVIVRALGMKEQVQVEVTRDVPRAGDLYLLCSDGLSGMVPDEQILEIIQNKQDPQEICSDLINTANANGGVDNITAVLAQVVPG
jgi:serine/threonine protein phosphatase PrpC